MVEMAQQLEWLGWWQWEFARCKWLVHILVNQVVGDRKEARVAEAMPISSNRHPLAESPNLIQHCQLGAGRLGIGVSGQEGH